MSDPSREELLDGLVQDAISVLHHDTTDDDVVDKYERDILRKKFLARLAASPEARIEARAAKPERERVIEIVRACRPHIHAMSVTDDDPEYKMLLLRIDNALKGTSP